jgi:hypothetical protein
VVDPLYWYDIQARTGLDGKTKFLFSFSPFGFEAPSEEHQRMTGKVIR